MDFLEVFLQPSAWIALLTLTFLEIVLGIDNIVFLSIISAKLPQEKQVKARFVGLVLAMLFRIMLLFSISLLMRLSNPILYIDWGWIQGNISGKSIIIFLGGLFLLYKSVSEIHHKFEKDELPSSANTPPSGQAKFWMVIAQIVALDMVFSIDSVLTAVGLVSFREFGYQGAMTIMVLAVVVSVIIMLISSSPISKFVNKYPTIQMLALSFLILIGVMLLAEASHLAQVEVLGIEVGEIPKGYIYFAIAFSLLVEFFNLKLSKKQNADTPKEK